VQSPLQIALWDERLSSVAARLALGGGEYVKLTAKEKQREHEVAAQLVLEVLPCDIALLCCCRRCCCLTSYSLRRTSLPKSTQPSKFLLLRCRVVSILQYLWLGFNRDLGLQHALPRLVIQLRLQNRTAGSCLLGARKKYRARHQRTAPHLPQQFRHDELIDRNDIRGSGNSSDDHTHAQAHTNGQKYQ
jgi:hypothetical protein